MFREGTSSHGLLDKPLQELLLHPGAQKGVWQQEWGGGVGWAFQ